MGTDLRWEKELAGQISGERTFQVKKKKLQQQRPQGKSISGWLEELQEIARNNKTNLPGVR